MSVLKVYNGSVWEAVGSLVGSPDWADYTPANTNITVGNGTQTARYCQFGKTVFVRYSLVWGSTTSFGGVIQIGLPVAARASTTYVGAVYFIDYGTQHYSGSAVVGSTTASTMNVYSSATSGSGDITGTTPFTWAVNDKLMVTVVYEAAVSSLALTGSEVWSDYTPTLTQLGAVTNTLTRARYTQNGKTVKVSVVLTVTGSGTGGNRITVSLPVDSAFSISGFHTIGVGRVYDDSAGQVWRAHAVIHSASTVRLEPSYSQGGDGLGVTGMGAGLANNDVVEFSATYESV